MIEHVEIDSDEGGWLLILRGDLMDEGLSTRLTFRLPGDQAVALLREVDEKIRPWHVEGESVRHDHERYRRTGELPDYVPEDRLESVPPTPRRQEGDAHASPSELLADRADYERKRDRENR